MKGVIIILLLLIIMGETVLLTNSQQPKIETPAATTGYPGAGATFLTWAGHAMIGGNGYVIYELLDTFINHVQLSTNGTARFMVMTLWDYANWSKGESQYTAVTDVTGVNFNQDVTITQGCAEYVLVIQNLGSTQILLTPNISVTYQPSTTPTGVCN